ncbi:DUF1405 domain-containing protein [Sporosarcina aquimarina]|uniref:DUF1405 domain-containing protein n=1 Tax=Sporosarcina aquimarina TaxID=114975 RepID=UPI00203EB1D4|nr:DUF1405 domain-containing protein [Sporosarcina aquimarina]MCM3756880.1 DUF1405 domain-containing protein [Sporosarcina aquimarina]
MQLARTWIRMILFNKSFLWILLFINIIGTVYGYDWYMWQLEITEPIYWIFVPDSPTASLFFCFVIIGWLLNTNFKLFEALALITLVKYGVWAVVMNLLTLNEVGTIGPAGWMLVISHGAMALQGVLYWNKYKFGMISIFIAAVWTLHNDVIDYVFGQMPIYGDLMKMMDTIGYFTFWLSIACILLTVWNWKRRHKIVTEPIH